MNREMRVQRPNEIVAERLAIRYRKISLFRTSAKYWSLNLADLPTSVEKATLKHFKGNGWDGYAGEGGLILNLIKAASFPELPLWRRATAIQGIYHHETAFENWMQIKFSKTEMLASVKSASREQIENNFLVMTSYDRLVLSDGKDLTQVRNRWHDDFPDLNLKMAMSLFDVLGTDRLYEIAKIFSLDPFKYAKGWPDLTVWNDSQVLFAEVKAPGDKIRQSQIDTISEIILKLDFDCELIDIDQRKL